MKCRESQLLSQNACSHEGLSQPSEPIVRDPMLSRSMPPSLESINDFLKSVSATLSRVSQDDHTDDSPRLHPFHPLGNEPCTAVRLCLAGMFWQASPEINMPEEEANMMPSSDSKGLPVFAIKRRPRGTRLATWCCSQNDQNG